DDPCCTRPIAGDDPTLSAHAGRRQRQTHDQNLLPPFAVADHLPSPVWLILERPPPAYGDLLAPLDQPRTRPAHRHGGIELTETTRRRGFGEYRSRVGRNGSVLTRRIFRPAGARRHGRGIRLPGTRMRVSRPVRTGQCVLPTLRVDVAVLAIHPLHAAGQPW